MSGAITTALVVMGGLLFLAVVAVLLLITRWLADLDRRITAYQRQVLAWLGEVAVPPKQP